jgi:hypothetical protein
LLPDALLVAFEWIANIPHWQVLFLPVVMLLLLTLALALGFAWFLASLEVELLGAGSVVDFLRSN